MSDSEPPSPAESDRPPELDRRRSLQPHPATSLRFVSVEYADRPDRCTIHPPDVEGVDLMCQWLTADRGDFADLAEHR